MPIFRRENGQLAAVPGNYAILDQIGQLPLSTILDLDESYSISDNLIHSHDAEASTGNNSYTKLKTITISGLCPSPSTIRIKFDLRKTPGGGGALGRIYKNGGVFGTERIDFTGTYQTFTEDLSFARGDTLELWAYTTDPFAVYVRNFRVYGDANAMTLSYAINHACSGVVGGFIASNS